MGEAKKKVEAQDNVELATIILATLKEKIGCPKEADIEKYITEQYTRNDKLIMAMRYNENGNLSAPYIDLNTPLKDLDISVCRLRRAVDHYISFCEHQAEIEKQKTKIIQPGDKSDGGIIGA